MVSFNGKLIYIAGPITAPTHYRVAKNVARAHDAILKWAKLGWAVHCPHKNTEFLSGSLSKDPEVDFEAWIDRDLHILAKCDAVYMLRGWEKSRGSKIEHKRAQKLGLQIFYEEDENGVQRKNAQGKD